MRRRLFQTDGIALTRHDVTRILDALDRGEPTASDELLPLVYAEMKKLAANKMSHERVQHTLQPTALVHEAYMRLVGGDAQCSWDSRAHFLSAAAEAMRRILIESARRKQSQKRGGELSRVDFDDQLFVGEKSDSEALLAMNDALDKLKIDDPETHQLVMLRYFGGLTIAEAAQTLGVSPRTANRNWSFARAWLQREIENE